MDGVTTVTDRGVPPDEQRALKILDVIDGIVDDTHPEGDGCPLCTALDDLRDVLTESELRLLDGNR